VLAFKSPVQGLAGEEPGDQWVHVKTSEKPVGKAFRWGNSQLPPRRQAESRNALGRGGDTPAGQPSRQDSTCKTLCSEKGLTCLPLLSESHHGKQEVFHQGHIRNTETVTTGL